MSRVLQASYIWENRKKSQKKRNQDLGNLFSYFFVFAYFLIFIFGISGGLYPSLKSLDLQTLGYTSAIVNSLGFIANRWWLISLFFIFSLFIALFLSFIVSRETLNEFKVNIGLLKEDISNLSSKTNFLIINDVFAIAVSSIISFLIIEIVSFAISSIMFILVIPLIISNNSFGILYLVVLITQVITFPLLLFIYDIVIKRRRLNTTDINYKKFVNEEGEVDLEKWRASTWGKKPYSFDWDSEEYFPISCFSCGSIISSNLTKCPICQTDLVKEIEEINAEYSINNGRQEEDSVDLTDIENNSE